MILTLMFLLGYMTTHFMSYTSK